MSCLIVLYFSFLCNRELPEKMSLGALMLEPVNKDFWVTLGSMSSYLALKQHSFIRALHLDMSLSEAWACLGKVLLLKQQLIYICY
jgi:hypothetical protein